MGLLGIQQLTRTQGLEWGDPKGDNHFWFEGHRIFTDADLVVQGASFGGPSPWIDATALAYGVSAGNADNTDRLQAALTAAASTGAQGTPSTVFLPPGSFTLKGPIFVPSWVVLRGASARGSVLAMHSTFPTSTPMIYGGLHDGASVFGCRVEDLWLECNRVVGSTGFFSNQLNELSGLKRVTVTRYMDAGVRIIAAPPIIGSYNWLMEDLNLNASETTTGSFGIDLQALLGSFAYGKISRVSVVPNGTAQVGTSGIRLTGAGEQAAWLEDIHVENHVNGIHFDTNSMGTADGVTGGGASGTTNVVLIDTARSVVLKGLRGTIITNLIQDNSQTITITATRWGLYGNDAAALAVVQLASGSTAFAPLRIPHGVAPTSPVNGDMWTTSSGLFVRINGSTIGPLS